MVADRSMNLACKLATEKFAVKNKRVLNYLDL